MSSFLSVSWILVFVRKLIRKMAQSLGDTRSTSTQTDSNIQQTEIIYQRRVTQVKQYTSKVIKSADRLTNANATLDTPIVIQIIDRAEPSSAVAANESAGNSRTSVGVQVAEEDMLPDVCSSDNSIRNNKRRNRDIGTTTQETFCCHNPTFAEVGNAANESVVVVKDSAANDTNIQVVGSVPAIALGNKNEDTKKRSVFSVARSQELEDMAEPSCSTRKRKVLPSTYMEIKRSKIVTKEIDSSESDVEDSKSILLASRNIMKVLKMAQPKTRSPHYLEPVTPDTTPPPSPRDICMENDEMFVTDNFSGSTLTSSESRSTQTETNAAPIGGSQCKKRKYRKHHK